MDVYPHALSVCHRSSVSHHEYLCNISLCCSLPLQPPRAQPSVANQPGLFYYHQSNTLITHLSLSIETDFMMLHSSTSSIHPFICLLDGQAGGNMSAIPQCCAEALIVHHYHRHSHHRTCHQQWQLLEFFQSNSLKQPQSVLMGEIFYPSTGHCYRIFLQLDSRASQR